MEDLPDAGQPDVRKIVIVFKPLDETKPVVVDGLDTECCYAEGEHHSNLCTCHHCQLISLTFFFDGSR